jgi:hypothetical protein
MQQIMPLLFILQLCVISVAPVYASQNIALPTTEASNKAATDALLEAVRRKETTADDITALIIKGADVNIKDQSGNTPIILAVCNGLADACIALIAKGADVNAKNKYGWTPLIRAANNGLADVCLALINTDADVNAIDNDGWTPLIWAANNGLADLCLALINTGANVNATNQYGNTPLMWAAGNGHRDVCILLLRHMLLKQLLTLKKTTMSKELIPLIVKSKPLMHDYIACRYDTYCCRPRLNEYYHSITIDQLYNLLGQGTIDTLKAAMQHACDTCDDDHTALKNLLSPVDFDQHFNELFLKPLKPTTGE